MSGPGFVAYLATCVGPAGEVMLAYVRGSPAATKSAGAPVPDVRLHQQEAAAPRAHQGEDALTEDDLIGALVELSSHTYGASKDGVRRAAERTLAMRHSDKWNRTACHLDSLLIDERSAPVAAYAESLAAVRR